MAGTQDPLELSALQAAAEIAAGRLTSERLVEMCLDRISRRDDAVGAWVHLDPERALEEARARDRQSAKGALHGVPVGVKDNLDTFDMPTSYGSPIYRDHRPAADAACVALLRDAGMVVLGKTVTTEMALRLPGGTRNPHNPQATPGGSSSGSAASVADGQVPLAIGTQTAGSVIRPASYCGTVGYKPTFGRIPRNGLKLISESLDTIGIFARTVPDAAAFASVLEGAPVLSLPRVEGPPRLGFCRSPGWPELELPARRALDEGLAMLRDAGATVVEVELPPSFKDAMTAQQIIQSYEAWRSLAFEFTRHRDQLSLVLQDYVAKGAEYTREEYDHARNIQASCRAAFWSTFNRVDAVITPAAPGEAPRDLTGTGSPVFNRLWTLLGAPCVTVPGLIGPHGLPIGLQVVGSAGQAPFMLARAHWIHSALKRSLG